MSGGKKKTGSIPAVVRPSRTSCLILMVTRMINIRRILRMIIKDEDDKNKEDKDEDDKI